MNMMRYYNHDPCLPPVSPFTFMFGSPTIVSRGDS
jgi:hypothetical protein